MSYSRFLNIFIINLFQVILPALLEQSHTRTWLKGLVRAWCTGVAWILDLRSYLLGDEEEENSGAPPGVAPPAPLVIPQPPAAIPPADVIRPVDDHRVAGGLGAAHQALLQRESPTGYQPYERPRWFAARLIGLLAAVCVTLVVASLSALTLPVWLGRRVMAIWLVGAPPPSPQVHEYYYIISLF